MIHYIRSSGDCLLLRSLILDRKHLDSGEKIVSGCRIEVIYFSIKLICIERRKMCMANV